MELVDNVEVAHHNSPAEIEIVWQLADGQKRTKRMVLEDYFWPGRFFADSNQLGNNAGLLKVDHRFQILVEFKALYSGNNDSASVQIGSVDLKAKIMEL